MGNHGYRNGVLYGSSWTGLAERAVLENSKGFPCRQNIQSSQGLPCASYTHRISSPFPPCIAAANVRSLPQANIRWPLKPKNHIPIPDASLHQEDKAAGAKYVCSPAH